MKCNHNCNPCRCGMAEGEGMKADALALLESRREVYIRRGRRGMLQTMLNGDGTATADDVRAAVELPPGIDPRCLGSVPGVLAYARIIGPAGFVRSTRPERHASHIQVWELVDCAKAILWLRDHPDLQKPCLGEVVAGKRQGVLFNQETATPAAGTVGVAK